VTKKFKRIFCTDLLAISNLSKKVNEMPDNACPWGWSFELKSKGRSFLLFAPTEEERDLWVNGFHRLLGVPVNDLNFEPMAVMTKTDMLNHQNEVMQTEGDEDEDEDNLAPTKYSNMTHKPDTIENEEIKDETSLSSHRSSRPEPNLTKKDDLIGSSGGYKPSNKIPTPFGNGKEVDPLTK
jgi:hypothetical protein